MLKSNKGIIFLVIGCLLLAIASGWYIYNITEDKNAGKLATDILNKFDNAPITTPTDNNPIVTINSETFCGKVIIDKLAVQLPVYNEWSYDRLKSAPCRYMGSIATDDIIIAAHNYKSHFGALNKLAVGDEIQFVDVYGKTHIYNVCELAILDGTAVSDMQAGEWDFTLFTCAKGGQQRVTVRCKQK